MLSFEDIPNIIKNFDQKTLIVCDGDLDGVTASILMKKILDKLNKENIIYVRIGGELGKRLINKIVSRFKRFPDIKNIVFLDTPLEDNLLIYLAERNKDKKILYIDHHKREVPKDLPENLIYFDVRAIYNLEISTSNIVYKIGKLLFNDEFKKYSIIASVGSVGDFMFGNDEELMKDLMEAYPSLYNGKSFTPPFFIYYFFFMTVHPFILIRDPDKDLAIDELMKFIDVKKMQRGFYSYYYSIKSLNKIYEGEKLIVYESKGRTSVTSTFLGALRNKVILVISKNREGFFKDLINKIKGNEKYRLSIRTQDNKNDVGKLMEKFAKQYGITGGGHPKAAGGLVYKKDLKKLINFLEENLK